ncbi:MAG: FkbM family methyltransferase [Lachnospiraceae bacterium]|nr:FkbM family methyltransferase [Lachnospiraceae bacterium]
MYLFPFSKIKQGSDIVIYGAGNIGRQYAKQLELTGYCRVICVADRSKDSLSIDGVKVCHPDEIDYADADAVVIAIENKNVADQVKADLEDRGAGAIVWKIIPFEGADSFAHMKEYVSYSSDNSSVYSQKLTSTELSDLKKFLAPMKIHRFDKMNLIRVGGDADGGYVMHDDLCGKVAYSIGIGDEISWDKDMADRGYDLFMYDFTVDKLPFENDRFHFFKKGITGSRIDDPIFCTLDEAMEQNGHDGLLGMILKMDIEGGEWEFFEKVDDKLLQQFDQLVFEIHGLLRSDRWAYYGACLERLGRTHSLIHVHANNYSKYALIDGLRLADCMELTYVRNAGQEFEFDDSTLPRKTDRPNIAGLDETDLGRWNRLIDRINSKG